ncbi:MAG: DUF1559 domain-containing protein [Planctomycetia bacterium]|nr:DUF1559 domain-containing protein [Planctomycetia bacterium]
MFRYFYSLLVFILLLPESVGKQPGSESFSSFIYPKTMVFLHMRVHELYQSALMKEFITTEKKSLDTLDQKFEISYGIKLEDIDTFTWYVDQFEFTREESPDPQKFFYMLLVSRKDLDYARIRSSLESNVKTIRGSKYEGVVGATNAYVRINDRTVLLFVDANGRQPKQFEQDVSKLLSRLEPASEVPERLKASVAQASEKANHLVLGFQMPVKLGQFLEDQLKEAPQMAAPFKGFARMQSMCLTSHVEPQQQNTLQLKSVMHFSDDRDTRLGLAAMKYGLATGKITLNNMPLENAPRTLENFWVYAASVLKKQLDQIKIEPNGNDVVTIFPLQGKEFLPVISMLIEKVHYAANKVSSAMNMKQLMIAMHEYHADQNCLPPVMSLKDGKPLHSWRVHILPYLGEAKLHQQLRLDEPWDSDHNRKVFESNPMPKVFAHPTQQNAGNRKTPYQMFYSSAQATKPAAQRLGTKVTLGQITVNDGTSNTGAMVEHGNTVLWYQPVDIEFDGSKEFPVLKPMWPGNRIQIAMYDASIHTGIYGDHGNLWKAVFTWRGDERLDFSPIID